MGLKYWSLIPPNCGTCSYLRLSLQPTIRQLQWFKQNGVWIFPDGTTRWRHLMGRKSALFERLEAMGRKQLVNAAGGGRKSIKNRFVSHTVH